MRLAVCKTLASKDSVQLESLKPAPRQGPRGGLSEPRRSAPPRRRRRRTSPRRHHRDAQKTATRETTYDASRRFFFFDDFFSFFFDDGTGVSSGFLFPATCTNAPDAGAAPAAVPNCFAFASSIS